MTTGARSGGARHLQLLLPALTQLGVECEALVGDDGPLAEQLRAQGIRSMGRPLMGSRWRNEGVHEIASHLGGYDLVHAHGTRAANYLVRASVGASLPPWVYTVHGLAFRQSGGLAHRAVRVVSEALSCQSAGHVICVAAADRLAVRSLVSEQRCSHIPNPIAPSRALPKALARGRLGLGLNDAVVGCVARLTPGKGLHVLVEAMARVRPGAALAIVGEGEERQRLLDLAERRGVKLVLCGERDDVPEVLSAFDVFALPSFWEGEPLALLEALHAGLFCIAADNSGSREVLGGSSNGVLVPPGEAGALAQAISQALDAPPGGQTVASSAATRSPEVIAARVFAVYRQLLFANEGFAQCGG